MTRSNYYDQAVAINNPPGQFGKVAARIASITCQNTTDCGKMTLDVRLHERSDYSTGHFDLGQVLQSWTLIPESGAKPQPECIPRAIVEDYSEACRIKDLSPKASATLARRCLQGMIRDFCGISKARLIDEIRELRTQLDEHREPRGVTHESVDAIDAVREVGNIGAHMEKDVDLIVEIDDNEAQVLIDLIETLFEDWYVARETRKLRFAGPLAIAQAKRAEKQKLIDEQKAKALPPPSP
ncbi:DUF4145 domain-containing protein [Bradyrhizobium centrolobii]|uniref:DUF4145 domain-containing protein n=1 Tax=Bradyrhizobium centrolobii TaxID=1505087 RepID=UPI000AB925B1|nr:DUF4145 domain-containing protein [Bradyrhizobium centrolobii]